MLNNNSAYDYIESILVLHKKNGYARSVDISRHLGVTKPSVCNALKKLKDQQMIYFGEKGHIFFTEDGKSIAEDTYYKRMTLMKVLTDIGVSEDTATREAGLIGHAISDETYRCLAAHFNVRQRVSAN